MSEKNKIRLLLVEDDYLVGETIKRSIAKLGYELTGKASTGEEAIDMACSTRPDVVLMDIKLPGIDGLEATQRIQNSCPVPVVILTAHESSDLIKQASEVGAGAYITKPPRTGEIERAITIALARHDDLMKLQRLNEKLEKSLHEIKSLKGLLPLCSFCKKIRDDKGYWNQVDVYIAQHSLAEISHSICPDCVKEHYPETYE